MNEQAQQQRVFAVICILFLFFIWSQNTLNPFTEQITGAGRAVNPGAAQQVSGTAPAPEGGEAVALPDGLAPASGTAPAVAGESPASGYPTDKEVTDAGVYVVSNQNFVAQVSALGGRLVSLKLKDYAQSIEIDSERYEIVSHKEGLPYPFAVYSGNLDDSRVVYKVAASDGFKSAANNSLDVKKPARLVLEGEFSQGQTITKTLSFEPDSSRIGIEVALSSPSGTGAPLEFEISKYLGEDDPLIADTNSGAVWFDGKKAEREYFSKLTDRTYQAGAVSADSPLANMRWTALSEPYFTQVLMSEKTNSSGQTFNTQGLYRSRLTQGSQNGSFAFYGLPKDFDLLKNMPDELHRTVDFGLAGFLSVPLLSILHALNKLLGNYGVSIVALTILVKLALYPLNAAQFKSMKAMQKLQPEMKRIRENVKDKQDQQMQLMALYKKEQVNPLGGCLPMVLQMPIFLGLYFGLMVDFNLRQAPFAFWIKDLSVKEGLMIGDFGLPVLVVLMVIAMAYQTYTTPSTMEPAQKKIMMFMPIMFGFIFASFPAGLTLYWLTNSLVSIGQQKGMYSEKISALKLTLIVSLVVFLLAFLAAQIG